jgi:hypothetical protein
MSLLILVLNSYLDNKFRAAIVYGCIAVLCTGWPFIGVLLLPLGLVMLCIEYRAKRIAGIINLCLFGIAAVLCIFAITISIERHYYGKW